MEDKLFELMTKMYNEMQDMKSNMATKDDLNSVKCELKQDIAQLEHKTLNKINALFDARQMQIDHETAMARDIKQMQGTVEKIELKIIRNSQRGLTLLFFLHIKKTTIIL